MNVVFCLSPAVPPFAACNILELVLVATLGSSVVGASREEH